MDFRKQKERIVVCKSCGEEIITTSRVQERHKSCAEEYRLQRIKELNKQNNYYKR